MVQTTDILSGILYSKKSEHTGHVSEELVFVSEHRSGPDNRCAGESLFDEFFSFCFRAVESRRGCGGRVKMGDMDKVSHSTVLCNPGQALGTESVDVPEGKVSRWLLDFEYSTK